MHDGLIVIWRVQVCDEVVLILVKVVLLSCRYAGYRMCYSKLLDACKSLFQVRFALILVWIVFFSPISRDDCAVGAKNTSILLYL